MLFRFRFIDKVDKNNTRNWHDERFIVSKIKDSLNCKKSYLKSNNIYFVFKLKFKIQFTKIQKSIKTTYDLLFDLQLNLKVIRDHQFTNYQLILKAWFQTMTE